MTRISVPFANSADDTWVSHIVYSLAKEMAVLPGIDLQILAESVDGRLRGNPLLKQPVPGWLHWLVYRLDGDLHWLKNRHEKLCLRHLRNDDISIIWPDNRLSLYRRAKEAGSLVVKEMINCHLQTVREIMDAEGTRIGVAIDHGITDARIAAEDETLALADLVMAPNPMVHESLLASGVAEEKIVRSSFGWSPERIPTAGPRPAREGKPRAVFVGTLNLRKGVHLLLEAFAQVRDVVDLVLCGAVTDELAEHSGALLEQDGISALGHVEDVGAVLAAADLFVMPSLEEGGPLVTFEAMAKSLPVLCSPMGSAGVVEHGREGLHIDPHDIEAFAQGLRTLAEDAQLRRRMGQAAATTADLYTWDKVAARRLRAIQDGSRTALPGPVETASTS